MDTCFVIQPFDGGVFDKRYDDVIAPAIREADLEPYRVDQDPSVEIPIEEIENGIRKARICLAEITTNNPNVWYELGYALASRKSTVLVCAEERGDNFPFDVRHRHILKYKTESSSDFNLMKGLIIERIKALLEKEDDIQTLSESSLIAETEGLSQHEVVALASVMENEMSPSDTVYSGTIQQDMNRAGYTNIAASLAIRNLLSKKLVSVSYDTDINGNEISYFQVTSDGENWLQNNIDKLLLKRGKTQTRAASDFDDDIPF